VASNYDANTRRFLRFGESSSNDAIHRGVWMPGVTSTAEAADASTAAGADAIQANGSSHANQDWEIVLRSGSTTVFNLRNRHSRLCLGISGASTANGAQAAQFGCNYTAPNQGWQATN
jgi:hypothetical protein